MTEESDPMAVLASAVARSLGLPIDPVYLPGIGRNLALLYEHAAKLQALDISGAQHQAPIYRP
ncbi:MAG TPA: AtzG-like protein [Acidisphaera sp.]|nr:AtzG-like protein [Acidisphaera sp.]